MDTQMVDQEPHRRYLVFPMACCNDLTDTCHVHSVQLIRRIDTRIPGPLLSEVVASTGQGSLGKLADFRNMNSQSVKSVARSPTPTASIKSASSIAAVGTQRGWTSVISQSGSSAPGAGAGSITGGRLMVPVMGRTAVVTPPTTTAEHNDPAPLGSHLTGVGLQSRSDVPDDWEDDLSSP